MAISLSIDNCLIQVRSSLQGENIKLWVQPYYVEGIGPIDSELEVNISNKLKISTYFGNAIFIFIFLLFAVQSLAGRLSSTLNIPYNYCLSAINELQSNAIDKLKARDLFKDTG